jgi:hypothetical protein
MSRIPYTGIIYTWTKAAYSSGWPSLEGFGTVLARKARTCMKVQADKEKLITPKHCLKHHREREGKYMYPYLNKRLEKSSVSDPASASKLNTDPDPGF